MHKVKVQLPRATVLASCLFSLNKAKEVQAMHCVTVGNESNATGVKCTAIDLICNLFN